VSTGNLDPNGKLLNASGSNLTQLANTQGYILTQNGKPAVVSTKALDRAFAEWTDIPAGVKPDILAELFATMGTDQIK
jgi:hypothetical protein